MKFETNHINSFKKVDREFSVLKDKWLLKPNIGIFESIMAQRNCDNCNEFIHMQPFEKTDGMKPKTKSTINLLPEKWLNHFNSLNYPGFSIFPLSEAVQREASAQTAPRSDTRYGLGMRNRFGLYDATLNRDIRTLTLQMRIAFNFTGPWPSDAAKTEWFREFKRLVENRWSYRFYLIPDGVGRFAEDQTTYFARLNVEQVTSNPHFTANVAYTTTHLGSSANSVDRTASLDSMDIEERTRESGGMEYHQRGVEHEFGHMLGIAHIECDDVTGVCPEGDQYGDTSRESSDIMGRGWIVSERDYYPFITSMYYFTGCNWKASHQMYNP